MRLIIDNLNNRKIIQIMFLRVRKLLNYKIPKLLKRVAPLWGIIWINKIVLLIQIIFEFKRFDENLNSKDLVKIFSESLVNQK